MSTPPGYPWVSHRAVRDLSVNNTDCPDLRGGFSPELARLGLAFLVAAMFLVIVEGNTKDFRLDSLLPIQA